jgi:hypothetical protein
MNIFNIIEIICTIAAIVCMVVALVLLVVAEVKARKLRREIEEMLNERGETDS